MSLPIDHINRYVSNVDKFIAFYESVLCYKLIARGKKYNGTRYAILKGLGQELFISEKEDFNIQIENVRHIGYSVDNADKTLEQLKDKGYAETHQQVIVKPYSRQIYIRDPDGMEIDLIQWTDKQGFYDSLKIDEEV
ncbi:MAG TPA: VOC family protein [Patescibacteria group bacterium]|nr:VOC family protein [Patescibacteria group bacterium]